MEVGTIVYCNKGNLQNAEGTITRTRVLGVEKSMIVTLENEEKLAFFGDDVNCVTTTPLDLTTLEDTTGEKAEAEDTTGEKSKKRVLRKR